MILLQLRLMHLYFYLLLLTKRNSKERNGQDRQRHEDFKFNQEPSTFKERQDDAARSRASRSTVHRPKQEAVPKHRQDRVWTLTRPDRPHDSPQPTPSRGLTLSPHSARAGPSADHPATIAHWLSCTYGFKAVCAIWPTHGIVVGSLGQKLACALRPTQF